MMDLFRDWDILDDWRDCYGALKPLGARELEAQVAWLLRQTDPLGRQWTLARDSAGNLTSVSRRLRSHRLLCPFLPLLSPRSAVAASSQSTYPRSDRRLPRLPTALTSQSPRLSCRRSSA
jgi:YD repeat-containing protein